MRMLYIDMIAFYLQKAGGITSVWKELILRFLRDNKNIILILQKGTICDNIYFEQIMAYQPRVIYESGKLGLNRYMPVRCRLEEGSGFISTYYRFHSNRNCRQYVLIHDFTYEYYVKGIKKWVHSLQKREAVKHADTTICVSENTRKDMNAFYKWTQNKQNYVIYNAANDIYKKKTVNVSDSNRLDGIQIPYLLYVGSRAPYKRFDIALELAAKCHYALVIVGGGRISLKEEETLKNSIHDQWTHIQGIADEELSALYQKAFALVYPSEYEGFGIPLIEAQGVGCPVIACDCSSISEVIQDESILMKQNNVDEAKRILKMLEDREIRKNVIEKGYRNAERFSWERTYGEYMKVIEMI